MRPLLVGFMLAIGLAPQLPGMAQEPVPAAPVAPSVKLTFEPGGLVSLSVTNASLRDILTEWTRKGGTMFNGAEKLAAVPVNLQYDHRPEIEVMNSLLRGAAGVVMAPRDQVALAGVSGLGIVFITATSSPTAGGYSAPAYTAPQPQQQFSTQGSPDQEIAPVSPGRGAEPPQPSAPPPRPSGVSPVAVQVVPVPTAGSTPTPTPTPPPPSGPGRGGR
jgi:hypothetical protein